MRFPLVKSAAYARSVLQGAAPAQRNLRKMSAAILTLCGPQKCLRQPCAKVSAATSLILRRSRRCLPKGSGKLMGLATTEPSMHCSCSKPTECCDQLWLWKQHASEQHQWIAGPLRLSLRATRVVPHASSAETADVVVRLKPAPSNDIQHLIRSVPCIPAQPSNPGTVGRPVHATEVVRRLRFRAAGCAQEQGAPASSFEASTSLPEYPVSPPPAPAAAVQPRVGFPPLVWIIVGVLLAKGFDLVRASKPVCLSGLQRIGLR